MSASLLNSTLLLELPGAKFYRVNVAMDSSYATGGETLDLSSLGDALLAFIPEGAVDDLGYVCNPSVPSGATVLLEAYWGNYDASDGPLTEVTAATNLGSVVWTAIAIVSNL